MFLFVVILFTFTKITTATDSIQDQIERLPVEDQEKLLQQIQTAVPSARDALVGVAENWCCRTDPGVQAVSQTRQYTYYVRRKKRILLDRSIDQYLGYATRSTQMWLLFVRLSRFE